MRILAIGDVVGDVGIDIICKNLTKIKNDYKIDFTIANGENASERGITPNQANDLYAYGVDVITLGNHAFKRREILQFLDENEYILRPQNFPPQLPGIGYHIYNINNYNVLVINLIGRTNMEVGPENPFISIDKILKNCENKYDIAICDFHAEATSEKYALAFYLDGKIQALFGTHTHVKTADTRIFPNGMGYITDVGMTGPYWSVIGVDPKDSVPFFRGDLSERFKLAPGICCLNAVVFDIDEISKKCVKIENITILGD